MRIVVLYNQHYPDLRGFGHYLNGYQAVNLLRMTG